VQRNKILVTGAFGQIGTELTRALRMRHGEENVLATSRRSTPPESETGPVARLDVTDAGALEQVVRKERIDVIFHLAAILSATGEDNPQLAWSVNMNGLYNILEVARRHAVRQVFWPSSIAVFGPGAPRERTPQETIMRPTTVYGVTKVAGELLCDYYVERYGLDVRGVRYPGVISSGAPPGGGTTDYAVEMFYAALESRPYTCFVREDTVLPMIYMPDCINAALDLMSVEFSRLRHHNAFNVAAMSFSAGELAEAIRAHVRDFVCEFRPDDRQKIADSWPKSIDDSNAREEWNWAPRFDLEAMTAHMLESLRGNGPSD
jgi:nucleoside-diphosphate-sugar epimerase